MSLRSDFPQADNNSLSQTSIQSVTMEDLTMAFNPARFNWELAEEAEQAEEVDENLVQDQYETAFAHYQHTAELLKFLNLNTIVKSDYLPLINIYRETADAYVAIAEDTLDDKIKIQQFQIAATLYAKFFDLFEKIKLEKNLLHSDSFVLLKKNILAIHYNYAYAKKHTLVIGSDSSEIDQVASIFIESLKVTQRKYKDGEDKDEHINRLVTFLYDLRRLSVNDYLDLTSSDRRLKRYFKWVIANHLTQAQLEQLFLTKNIQSSIHDMETFHKVVHPNPQQISKWKKFNFDINDLDNTVKTAIHTLSVCFGDQPIIDFHDYIKEFNAITRFSARYYQAEAIYHIYNDLHAALTNGYLSMATGSGKTMVLGMVISLTKLKTLIIAPSLVLGEQIKKELLALDPTLSIGMYNSEIKEFDKLITITTYHSFIIEAEKKPKFRNLDLHHFELIACDEAHKELTKSRIRYIRDLFDSAIVISLTATPEYAATMERDYTSLESLHGKGRVYYSYPLAQGIKDGTFVPCNYHVVLTDISLKPKRKSLDKTVQHITTRKKKAAQINEKQAAKLANTAELNDLARQIYKQRHDRKPGIFFCAGKEHSAKMATTLKEHGTTAEAITGDLDKEVQIHNLEHVKSQSGVICGSDLIIEGLNYVDLISIFNLRPTSSPVVALQRAGRGARPAEGKDEFVVYDFDYDLDSQVFFGESLPEEYQYKKECITIKLTPVNDISKMYFIYSVTKSNLEIYINPQQLTDELIQQISNLTKEKCIESINDLRDTARKISQLTSNVQQNVIRKRKHKNITADSAKNANISENQLPPFSSHDDKMESDQDIHKPTITELPPLLPMPQYVTQHASQLFFSQAPASSGIQAPAEKKQKLEHPSVISNVPKELETTEMENITDLKDIDTATSLDFDSLFSQWINADAFNTTVDDKNVFTSTESGIRKTW